ncbi:MULTISPECIES: STAS domain-containing protein [unclassified Streptomyces]|uniref:STAS domain-containing protein n=1 Tax=unclassified Streptomyces TaxID=2593676 RepID=UPI003333BCFA
MQLHDVSDVPQILSRQRRGQTWVIALGGDLTAETLQPVRSVCQEAARDGKALVVDAKAVASADRSVLDLLMRLQDETVLVLAAPSASVQAMLEGTDHPVPVLSSASLGEALDVVGA